MDYILLPSTIEFKPTNNPHLGEFVITPCHQGYGTTLANSLRRVLLSSIEGAAVEAVQIEGVQHEFSAVPGVLEDAIEIMLNLKQLAVISHSDTPITLRLVKKGKGDVTAADFEKNADIEIINTDLKIATVSDDKKAFSMEVIIGKGLGYVPAASKESKNLDLGTIVMDSFYSPIKDVGYSIENTRVGDITDYEKLTIRIETNGTITPRVAVERATRIIMDHFRLILDTIEQMPSEETVVVPEETEKKKKKSKKDEE
ncbi:MAG: DNA-directed RNA polymerase subunit alpha [Candidatus Magasanikbacteria bacterium]